MNILLKINDSILKAKSLLLHYTIRAFALGYSSKIPQRNIVAGYLSYIIAGFILLSLPISLKQPVSIIDNLFIITSAVSTTGLVTVDINETYSIFGQIIILIFIQLGGIGYMTFSSYMMYSMTHHFVNIKKKTMNTAWSLPKEIDLPVILRNTVIFSILFEVIGAVFLYYFFSRSGVDNSLWYAVFHSISSFCTAGFSLFSDSMEQFRYNIGVNITISVLAYSGAMGFILLTDVYKKIKSPKSHLSFTSKIILSITTSIAVAGTALLFFNLDPTETESISERFMISFFQTMSAMTTVGFNSIDLGSIRFISMYILIIAMFIGASPSGTGGGVKSTTISAIYAFLKSKLSDERTVRLKNNRLPSFRVETAITNFIFYQIILIIGFTLLICTENMPAGDIFFEATSALGTVGLSTGITSSFSIAGKVILILLMYIGRTGVFIFGSFMLTRMSKRINELDKADIAI